MDEAIRKATVLVEALSWIQRFRGRYVVIKLGGSTLDQEEAVSSLLTDVVFMSAVGMRPIIVHGGGKSISRALEAAGQLVRDLQARLPGPILSSSPHAAEQASSEAGIG